MVTVWEAVQTMIESFGILGTPVTGTDLGNTVFTVMFGIMFAFMINNNVQNMSMSLVLIGIVVVFLLIIGYNLLHSYKNYSYSNRYGKVRDKFIEEECENNEEEEVSEDGSEEKDDDEIIRISPVSRVMSGSFTLVVTLIAFISYDSLLESVIPSINETSYFSAESMYFIQNSVPIFGIVAVMINMFFLVYAFVGERGNE